MATAATSHLRPPKDWDEFEDMCADTFQHQWGDRNATRYGRQGQRQNGVDIYGRPPDGGVAGVQCKGKRSWPPPKLTVPTLEAEVEAAKQFQPPLTEFTVATIDADDRKLQDRARELTVEHEKQGLFSVQVVGWGEITRRLTQYPNLVEKHFQYVALGTLREEIPERTAELVADHLKQIVLDAKPQAEHAPTLSVLPDAVELIEAAERDLTGQYQVALKRSLFPEFAKADRFHALGQELIEGKYARVSTSLRRTILLRATRSAAVRGEIVDAERFLSAAVGLGGMGSDVPARARLAEARGDIDGAIAMLRDLPDEDSRSTLLNIIFRHRGSDAAFDWFKENNLAVRDLTPNGLHTLTLMLLQNGKVEETRDALIEASAAQIEEAPYFLFLRGAARLACLFPKPDQALPLQGLPLDVRSTHIVVSEDTAAEQLDLAIAEFTRFQPMARDLQLDNAGRIAQAYLVWCELLHPRRKAGAVERLRTDMTSPQSALDKLQFAFAFIKEFDPAPIAHYLERRQQLGGLDDNDLRAALVLRMHGDSPREVADFLAKYRTGLEASFGKPGILSIEIQALTLAGDAASAKLLLQENEGIFERDFVAGLEAGIEKAEGADPVQAYRRAYEETRTPEALRALVRELARKKDHGALAGYAEELYRTTNDPEDIALAADAFFRAGDKTNFVRLAEQHGFLLDSYPHIARHYAWELLYLGRHDEARRVTDQFAAKGPVHRDLQLEIALAVETGEWERLAQPLAAYFDNADRFEGAVLIRAAHTAQASGHGPMLDLMKAAVQRAGNDPEVLLGAYLLTVEEGLEDTIAHSHEWFRRAVDLSGEDGPVRRFELKELLSQQTEWNERSRTVNEGISRGDFPLAIAAPGLRMTVVDAVLGNLVRNTASTDPRRMAAIPLFSGRRAPQRFGDVRRIALDSSALMVIGWLGLLPKVFTTFPEIVLPAGTLLELFEGRRRIRSFQKSRLKRAAEIRDVIAARRVKIVPVAVGPRDTLADEIGADLAGLIRAAELSDGVVLRPAPVHRPGLDMHDADMSAHMGRLTDMHALLDTLAQLGVLDQVAEETAKGYFSLQDRGWTSPVRPNVKQPLFIDDLALNYLQTTRLC